MDKSRVAKFEDILTKKREELRRNLARTQEVCHLGLNPLNLLIHGSQLLLGNFGLVQLVWVPTDQPPAEGWPDGVRALPRQTLD